jgi:hypothetical protein
MQILTFFVFAIKTQTLNGPVAFVNALMNTNGEYFEQQRIALSNQNRSDRDGKTATGNLSDKNVQPESQGNYWTIIVGHVFITAWESSF